MELENQQLIYQMLESCNNVIDIARERNLKPTNETRVIQFKTQAILHLLSLKGSMGVDATTEEVVMIRTLTNDLIVLIEAQLLIES